MRTLHAKGLRQRSVLFKHGLKNISVNLLTVISLLVSRSLGSSVVIEAVFAVPGIGSLIVYSALQHDFPVIQGIVFFMVIAVVCTNLIVDSLYAVVDPRCADERRSGCAGRRPGAPRLLPPPPAPLGPRAPRRRASALYLLLLVTVSVMAPWISPYSPTDQDYAVALTPPSAGHLLGADDLGRDTLSRLMHGGATSLYASALAVTVAFSIGVPLGLIAGFAGGFVDERSAASSTASLLSLHRAGHRHHWRARPGPDHRHVCNRHRLRAAVCPSDPRANPDHPRRDLRRRRLGFGAGPLRVLLRHVVPNAIQPIIVQVTISLAAGLLAEAGLSFLGLGIQAPTVSWGAMLARAYNFIEIAPDQMYPPGSRFWSPRWRSIPWARRCARCSTRKRSGTKHDSLVWPPGGRPLRKRGGPVLRAPVRRLRSRGAPGRTPLGHRHAPHRPIRHVRQVVPFFHLNLGKTSVALDRGEPVGRALLHALLQDADVVVVGTDEPNAADLPATCILAQVTGFGTDGPLAGWKGGELIHQALSGMMYHNGERDREPLHGCGHRASYAAGVATYIAALAALHARAAGGSGQRVSVDVVETACAMNYPYMTQVHLQRLAAAPGRATSACR